MIKSIPTATPADALLLNTIEPPTKGCPAGGGIHVVIPDDWQAQILAGNDVPGCTYNRIQVDGSLPVDDTAQALLASPIINTLPAQQQTQATNIVNKLNAVVANPDIGQQVISK